ncbi:MAG: PAS domain S-box protein [Desulfuromonadales bacterium]|nr:PAS domain S-box protein [Desulfuromonadales bacterium]
MWHDKKEYFRQSDGEFPGYRRGTGLIPRIVFLLFLFLALAVGKSGQALSDGTVSLTLQERQWLSQHDGQVRIGITVIPPQIIRDNAGYQGLSIDYIRLMERKLGCRFKLVPFATWNEVIQAAKMRRIDMIFAAQKTPDRLAYLLFTEPYIELPNMIVVRKDRQGAYSLKEMKGWSVAVSEGSAVQEFLLKEFAYLDLRPVHEELTGLMKVSLGEVDAMVVEISRASYSIEKAGILNLRVAGNAGLLYQLRFAVRNDWPVLSGILNKGLSSITGEERREISRRWIIVGEKSIFATRAFRISLVAVAGGIALTVIVVVVWNRTLRRTVRQRTSQLQQELAERKRAEEALRLSSERLQLATRVARIGIWDWDVVNNKLEWDESMYQLYGIRSEDFGGAYDAWIRSIHPEDKAHTDGEIQAALRGDREYAPEFRIVRPDGSIRYIKADSRTIKDREGRPLHMIGTNIDITEHKQAEEALRESEEKFRVLAETSPTAIIVYQGEHFVYVNPSAVRLFGYSKTELLEMKFWQWAHPDDREMVMNRGMARQRGEQVPAQYEHRFVKKSGEEGWVIVSAGSIEYQGKHAGIATFVDITETKRAEEKISAALAEKVVLLKEVHHRVKNNLQIICSLLDLQSDSITDEQSRGYFRESQNRVRSMALVHEQLYKSKDMSSIDFGEYIRDLSQNLFDSYVVDAERISLNTSGPAVILGINDAIPCGLIVNELVSNALKHAFPAHSPGEISIIFNVEENSWISLTVADNGIGFPAGLDIRNTPSLGLQLVNMLVKQLQGRITFGSEQAGAIISITFPGSGQGGQ